jgi:hypothetical protein
MRMFITGASSRAACHALLDVERGAHAGQRQPQLDQRDGDGRLHADQHGAGRRGRVAIAAVLLIMRPMKESTRSSAEMSISTPLARSRTMREVRSSCKVMARRSCMSTWIVTSSTGHQCGEWVSVPSSPHAAMLLVTVTRRTRAFQGHDKGVGQRGLGHDVLQVDAEVDDGLGDLRADAADDAIGAHQARGGDGLQSMLGHQRVDGGHAGDVDDGDQGAPVSTIFSSRLSITTCGAGAVERADQGQRQDVLPQLARRASTAPATPAAGAR